MTSFISNPKVLLYSAHFKKRKFKMARDSCNRPFNLKIHKRVHSGEKLFVCSQCNQSFTAASSLSVHIRTHSGAKPHNCKQCNYSCKTASNLKNHMLTHYGKSLLVAHSATIPAQRQAISSSTCSLIQGKAVSLHPMHLFLLNKGSLQTAHVNTFRGESFQL